MNFEMNFAGEIRMSWSVGSWSKSSSPGDHVKIRSLSGWSWVLPNHTGPLNEAPCDSCFLLWWSSRSRRGRQVLSWKTAAQADFTLHCLPFKSGWACDRSGKPGQWWYSLQTHYAMDFMNVTKTGEAYKSLSVAHNPHPRLPSSQWTINKSLIQANFILSKSKCPFDTHTTDAWAALGSWCGKYEAILQSGGDSCCKQLIRSNLLKDYFFVINRKYLYISPPW